MYLTPSYDPWLVFTSILIASFASYVALDLTKRINNTPGRGAALMWCTGGSIAMGSGIWSMHFVGMLAYSLPIPLGYTALWTFASWVAAVMLSAAVLSLASLGKLTYHRIGGGSIVMGAGICAMHYMGMAALDVTPAIVWNPWLIVASALIAVAASAAALLIFDWLRNAGIKRGLWYQIAAALLMGIAISGMHYTGMSAANFPEGATCLSANSLTGDNLGSLVMIASGSLLVLTLLSSILAARMELAKSLKVVNAQLQSANEELQKRAFLDPLTGLPNRVLFEDRLMHAVSLREHAGERATARERRKLAVLFIDLDGFKPINDSYGHAVGDLVLKEMASRLPEISRDCDTVARLGGDEFVLLIEDIQKQADCMQLAQRVVEVLARPFEAAEQQIEISGSVGVAIYPDHGPKDKLVAYADAAMYAVKRSGGNGCALFEPRMDTGALDHLILQKDLRRAIDLGQLQLYYQPKIDMGCGRISGVEALLRWNHPERGLLAPGVFISVAERFGLINGLGNWVIDEACRQMNLWMREGLRMEVAINLSVYQLQQDDLVSRISEALERNQVEPSQLTCEITESVAMKDTPATQRTFSRLAGIGVRLSIDDFGTGYSSLGYLRQLPARQLKIDRSFIADIELNGDARAVVNAVINLAHVLDLTVVAEGVETDGQQQVLRSLGCDELQGFLVAKPMPANTLSTWMNKQEMMGTAKLPFAGLNQTVLG